MELKLIMRYLFISSSLEKKFKMNVANNVEENALSYTLNRNYNFIFLYESILAKLKKKMLISLTQKSHSWKPIL